MMKTTNARCAVCVLSKTVGRAVVAHVRCDLDEPPEPMLCKYMSLLEYSTIIRDRLITTVELLPKDVRRTIN